MPETTPRAVTFIRVPAHSPERTAAYEDWYDSVHIPLRMAKPGFLGAQRYDMLIGRQRYFVLYELADASTVNGEEYVALRAWERQQPPDSFEAPGSDRPGFERGIYDQIAGPLWPDQAMQVPFVHVAGHHPASGTADDFRDFLSGRYLDEIAPISGVAAVRVFELSTLDMGPGTGMHSGYPRFIVVSYAETRRVLDDPLFVAAQASAVERTGDSENQPYVVVGRLAFSIEGDSLQDDMSGQTP